MAEKVASKSTPSTQKFLDIAEIREDVVLMNDGTMRAVMLVSSINFALKAETEQQALVSAYMDFLNSFAYPFQIIIQSRKLNLDKYLGKLLTLEKDQKNELLKAQMGAYRAYVKELIDIGDIMTKKFYVILPFSPYAAKKKNFFIKLKEVFTPGSVIKVSKKNFVDYKRELDIRVGQVLGSLNTMGLNAIRLDTQSLIEVYYNAYNPVSSASQPLEDVRELQVEA